MKTKKRTDPTRRILQNALNLLEKPGGWIKGEFDGPDGAHCSLGAIYAATGLGGNETWHAKVRRALNRFVAANQEAIGDCGGIVEWNDRSRRTKKQVLAAFRRAIRYRPEARR